MNESSACGESRPWIPLELELQGVLILLMWALGIKLRPSGKAVLHCQVILPVPLVLFDVFQKKGTQNCYQKKAACLFDALS